MNVEFKTMEEINAWLQTHVKDCRFIGISSDHEVFVEYKNPDTELELVVEEKIKETFPHIGKVVSVVVPSLKQLEETIEGLNKILAGEKKPQKPLLQIEGL